MVPRVKLSPKQIFFFTFYKRPIIRKVGELGSCVRVCFVVVGLGGVWSHSPGLLAASVFTHRLLYLHWAFFSPRLCVSHHIMRWEEKRRTERREGGKGKRKEQELLCFIVLEARKSKIEGPTCHFKDCFEDFIFNYVCV